MTSDFRTKRWKLPPEAFVIAPDQEISPTDLLDEQTWRSIVFLPDDVSIRTSDHHGQILHDAHDAWGLWVSLNLDLQALLLNPRDDALQLAVMSSGDEWQASTYCALTGFYRQAIACLRPALESMLTGAYFRSFPNSVDVEKWAEGHEDLRLSPSSVRRRLASAPPYTRFSRFLSDGGWCAWVYKILSAFQHGRPYYADASGKKMPTTNVELWQSNGPIYDSDAFELWGRMYFNTLLLCLLLAGLAEPQLLSVAHPTDLSYIAFLEKVWHSHPRPGPSPAAVSIAEYLDALSAQREPTAET